MVFQAVEVLVAFSADIAAVGLLFFHAYCAWVGDRGNGVDDGEGAVFVFLEFLVLVAMLDERSY
jgi:hypothetical protein